MTFKCTKVYAPTSEDSLYASPEFSPVFFTENIAKRQPLHRLSVQSPPLTPPFLYCDLIADKAYCAPNVTCPLIYYTSVSILSFCHLLLRHLYLKDAGMRRLTITCGKNLELYS